MDDQRARMQQALEQGHELGQEFVGLPERVARERAVEHPGFVFQFVPVDGAITLELRSNRVRLLIRDGVVDAATAG